MDALQIKLFFNYPISFTKDELTWTLNFFYWYLFNLLEDSLEKKKIYFSCCRYLSKHKELEEDWSYLLF